MLHAKCLRCFQPSWLGAALSFFVSPFVWGFFFFLWDVGLLRNAGMSANCADETEISFRISWDGRRKAAELMHYTARCRSTVRNGTTWEDWRASCELDQLDIASCKPLRKKISTRPFCRKSSTLHLWGCAYSKFLFVFLYKCTCRAK